MGARPGPALRSHGLLGILNPTHLKPRVHEALVQFLDKIDDTPAIWRRPGCVPLSEAKEDSLQEPGSDLSLKG